MDNKIGDYIILEKIAHGGMAEVYKAKTSDPLGIERLVVIKRILPHISSQPEYVEMLVDEAKIAVHCSHGNIAQIYDLGRIGDDYFIVMEYVDGKTISQILRAFRESGDAVPIDIAVYAILQVCRALEYIHHKKGTTGKPLGIVHRDISPQNIIVSYSGTVKVIDFGVAKSLEKLNHTEAGVLKGKFAYMSPEQARGDFVDSQSDLFSVGTLLWEALTQTRLFKRANNKETVQAVLKYPIPKPRDLRPDIPKALEKIIMKCLRRNKLFRYKDASHIANDLDVFLHQYYPDFKPLRVAEFLYQNFGAEPDEAHLPPEIKVPKKVVSDKTKKRKINAVEVETKKTRVLKSNIRNKVVILVGAVLFLSFLWFFIATPKARLIIEVQPGAAFLSINDQDIERVPEGLYVLDVPVDQDAKIRIRQSGYNDYEKSVELIEGETKKLQINLDPVVVKRSLLVESTPPCSELFLDDKPLNQPCPYEFRDLKLGQNIKIGFYLPNYSYVEKSLLINKDLESLLTVRLEPLPGSINFQSNPEGAQIFLNGEFIGSTPLLKSGLSIGNIYNIEVKAEGYTPFRQTLEITPGEKKELSIELNTL